MPNMEMGACSTVKHECSTAATVEDETTLTSSAAGPARSYDQSWHDALSWKHPHAWHPRDLVRILNTWHTMTQHIVTSVPAQVFYSSSPFPPYSYSYLVEQLLNLPIFYSSWTSPPRRCLFPPPSSKGSTVSLLSYSNHRALYASLKIHRTILRIATRQQCGLRSMIYWKLSSI